jgi:hypothetical protein
MCPPKKSLFAAAIVMMILICGCRTSPQARISQIIDYAHDSYQQRDISRPGANYVETQVELATNSSRVWESSFLVLGQSGLLLKADASKSLMTVLLLESDKPAIITEVWALPEEKNPEMTMLYVSLGEPPYLQKRNLIFFDSAARLNYCQQIANEIADQAVPSRIW